MKYCTTFSVTGNFDFPIDMLRYDECNPTTETDSNLIEATFHDKVKNPVIGLSTLHTTKRPIRPTVDRWDSFGWTVFLDSIQTRRI